MQMFQNLERSMKPGETLKVLCEPCGRRTTWTRTEAIKHCGPDATPADLRWRLTCGGCGVSGRAKVWI
jgi:hypothetical protein